MKASGDPPRISGRKKTVSTAAGGLGYRHGSRGPFFTFRVPSTNAISFHICLEEVGILFFLPLKLAFWGPIQQQTGKTWLRGEPLSPTILSQDIAFHSKDWVRNSAWGNYKMCLGNTAYPFWPQHACDTRAGADFEPLFAHSRLLE